MSVVPVQWTRALAYVQAARVARDCLRSAATTQRDRDAATVDYSRAVDGLFEQMDAAMEAGLTGRITMVLCKMERVK
jgi:hypothetical protein